MADAPRAGWQDPAPPDKRPHHTGFSMTCPGCRQDLDIYEDSFVIPPHPSSKKSQLHPAYPLGARFPAMTIGVVEVCKLCKFSGAQLEPRIRADVPK